MHKTIRAMKKQTKIRITSLAAGVALVMMLSTIALAAIEHPAMWLTSGTFLLSAAIGIFVGVTIED